ncbi:MAG: TIGR03915 family putative DNA repair protein [Pelobium sp.]
MKTWTYDHSFEGFLTAVFEVYEYRELQVRIRKEGIAMPELFEGLRRVITNSKKADRVYQKLKVLLGDVGMHRILYSLLSEDEECEVHILNVIREAIAHPEHKIMQNFADPSALKLSQFTQMVGREKHRMEAFVRFKLTCDEIYFAEIEPDFNVIPIIAKHFRDRYQDQKWLIFDNKRHYGIFYNLVQVETVEMKFNNQQQVGMEMLVKDEYLYQSLWRNYFSSTNIKARKNNRLHRQHVPKRYWKYLVEKSF